MFCTISLISILCLRSLLTSHLVLLQIKFKQPTPAETPLVVRSQVKSVALQSGPGNRARVQVELSLHKLSPGGKETLVATAEGIYSDLRATKNACVQKVLATSNMCTTNISCMMLLQNYGCDLHAQAKCDLISIVVGMTCRLH